MDRKEAIRAICRERIKNLSLQSFEKWGAEMGSLVCASEEWKNAGTVFVYASLPTEADTMPLLKNAFDSGKRVCVPKIVGRGVMNAVEIKSLSELKKGTFGIFEPDDDCPVAKADEIDLVILPCFAAGEDGTRLGKGGGYYDRFCARGKATRFALCPEAFIFGDGVIPTEEWDIKADFVVTEKRIIKAEETL